MKHWTSQLPAPAEDMARQQRIFEALCKKEARLLAELAAVKDSKDAAGNILNNMAFDRYAQLEIAEALEETLPAPETPLF